MEQIILALVLIITTLIIALFALKIFQKFMEKLILWAVNSAGGVLALLVLVYVFDFQIPVNLITLAAAFIFGFGGLGAMILLHLGGMI
jgi:hypothetical protein